MQRVTFTLLKYRSTSEMLGFLSRIILSLAAKTPTTLFVSLQRLDGLRYSGNKKNASVKNRIFWATEANSVYSPTVEASRKGNGE